MPFFVKYGIIYDISCGSLINERKTKVGISVEDAVKELQARETVFVAYSQATKLPYVTCGEETYNDQVWFFAEEETLKEYGKKKLEDKILLMGDAL